MRRSRGRRMVVGLVLAVSLGGCGGGGSEAPDRPSATVTGSFEVRTETFVDVSRSRTFETSIYMPGGAAALPSGGRPLIVFVHGSGGNPDFYRVLLEALAGSGYVVATPRLPPDIVNQPADVSYVITELLRLSAATSGPYTGLVDPLQIGVAGHSAGGVTVLRVGFNSCCIDRRAKAGAVLAADSPPFPGGTYFSGINTPLLVVHGVADPTVPFAEGRRIFTDASPPKLMLAVPASDTPSADHARPFVGTENRPRPDTRLVSATIIGFFDRYLRNDRAALARIRKAVDAEVSFSLDLVES